MVVLWASRLPHCEYELVDRQLPIHKSSICNWNCLCWYTCCKSMWGSVCHILMKTSCWNASRWSKHWQCYDYTVQSSQKKIICLNSIVCPFIQNKKIGFYQVAVPACPRPGFRGIFLHCSEFISGNRYRVLDSIFHLLSFILFPFLYYQNYRCSQISGKESKQNQQAQGWMQLGGHKNTIKFPSLSNALSGDWFQEALSGIENYFYQFQRVKWIFKKIKLEKLLGLEQHI